MQRRRRMEEWTRPYGFIDGGPARRHPGRGVVTDAVAHDANNLIGDLSFGEINENSISVDGRRRGTRVSRERAVRTPLT